MIAIKLPALSDHHAIFLESIMHSAGYHPSRAGFWMLDDDAGIAIENRIAELEDDDRDRRRHKRELYIPNEKYASCIHCGIKIDIGAGLQRSEYEAEHYQRFWRCE